MDDDAQPVVSEITVETSSKNWTQGVVSGSTTGSSITWKVISTDPSRAWAIQQAKVLTLVIKKEQLKLLQVDALAKGAQDTLAEITHVLAGYGAAIEAAHSTGLQEPAKVSGV